MPTVNPDLPVDSTEYEQMKREAADYGNGPLTDEVAREDRAFLIYEITKYELEHKLPQTFEPTFRRQETEWWKTV